ncbi:cupin domain-containing protein [Flavobacterium sp. SH_e]|uniref:(R)-mandelonitrile lyase n=1 Tax=Flavobacterium TaxID=237 RepID=UPI0021E45825|nr:cupin domain-containing protein [Flavobacterium sp. SH_e]MCV2485058.1 cupin domain-containing protein [Flavobacterium sp. SH_e]
MSTTEIFPQGEPLPNEWFTGSAFLKPLVARDKNNEFSAGSVTFLPRARTNWHTHPKGQVLLVTEGSGIYQEEGKQAQKINKGDVVSIPENIKHWHGASANSKMVHIAITNFKDDNQVTWLEAVSDEEYESANK